MIGVIDSYHLRIIC